MPLARLYPAVMLLACAASAAAITPPPQPADGPGSSRYTHAALRATVYGRGAAEYRILEPDGPRPESAPLVVFTHGWGALHPRIYGAWIEHIVRRGNIVIFPRYQADLSTPLDEFTPNALDSLADALRQLDSGRHVRPQLERVAFVGHSVGGILAVNLAACAAERGLLKARAVFSIQPGISTPIGEGWKGVPLEDLSKIPADTLLLAIVGDRDSITGRADAQRIYRQATAVKPGNKNLLLMQSDLRGTPPLLADHQSPAAMKLLGGDEVLDDARQRPGGAFAIRAFELAAANATNALDYYGYWKLLDALTDAAFHGRHRAYALGNTPEQTFMGRWSDGTPVKPLVVLEPR